jgi:hypothetical protein
MNDRGYLYNEAFFAALQTNRNYAGPLDMPWLDIGMCIMQWRNGIISNPLDAKQVGRLFFDPGVMRRAEYTHCLCIWRVRALKNIVYG